MTEDKYTFGDNDRASVRLRRLAEIYEPETRELLQRCGAHEPGLAMDLGCGPGWTTRLLRDVLHPVRTIGMDQSERYIAEARSKNRDEATEFLVHDVTSVPFPVPASDIMFCRFLLTHLREPGAAIAAWASAAAPGALLVVLETESLESDHPGLRRYYELVALLQRHYGQALRVGAVLEDCFQNSGWVVVESRRLNRQKPARDMAELHLENLRTWRHDGYASRSFSPEEIDPLEKSLGKIVSGMEEAGAVNNATRQVIAQRT